MKKFLIRVLYRLLEIMGGCIVMSAFICLLCVSGAMPVGSIRRDIVLALLSPAFIIWNMLSLRRHYFYLPYKINFYKVNLCVNIIFVLINVFAYVICTEKLYSWLFLVTYLLRFSSINITSIASILLFHTVLVLSVFVAPIGMEWVEIKAKERQELIERIPGALTVNPLEKKRGSTEGSQNEDERKENTLS